MATTAQTQNATVNFLNGLISAGRSGGETAVETAITAEFPFLANPVLQYLLDDLVSYVMQFISANLEYLVDAAVIDIQTNGEKSQVYQALLALSTKPGDANANAQADQSWNNLIKSDGSGTIIP